MKITRSKLKLIIENFLFEKKKKKEEKKKYVPKEEWPKYKAIVIESHSYGDPTKSKKLKDALLEKWKPQGYTEINQLLCKTCHAFDTSEEAKEAGVKEGMGYCAPFKFACSENNSCTGWLPK